MEHPNLKIRGGGRRPKKESRAQIQARLTNDVAVLARRVDVQQRLIMSMIDALLAVGVDPKLIENACAARNITFSVGGAADVETADAKGEPAAE